MVIVVTRVRFEHHTEAIGIGQSRPRLSWSFEGCKKDWVQECYEIEIRQGFSNTCETFTQDCEQSLLVPWPGRPLRSSERAAVRVRVRGHNETTFCQWSEVAHVEAGLLDSDEWQCSVISSPNDMATDGTHKPVMFRREFIVSAVPCTARLYITAHGVYEPHLNGKRVGDHVLAPGWTSYNHRLVYQTFDVTDLLQVGSNVLGAYVSDGWYCGRVGWRGNNRNVWGDRLGLQAQLLMMDEQTCKTWVYTDSEWKCTYGELISSELYDGENYDARCEHVGWSAASYDDREWDDVIISPISNVGRLTEPDGPPIRCVAELQAVQIVSQSPDMVVVDFGQNLAGWVKIRVSGPSGYTVTIRHSEVLENGMCATRPLRSAKATDTITLSGTGSMTWEPRFTYHGFRYAQFENWPGEFRLEDVTAIVIQSDMKRTGWFECSNSLLNKLHENVVWAMRGNFISIPTDCPQRDERVGWTGDLQVFARTACFLYDTVGMLQSWFKDVEREQNEDDSGIPHLFTPMPFNGLPKTPMSIWGDVTILAPWDVFNACGDVQLLLNQYHSMLAWIDKGIPRDSKGMWKSATCSQLGDWLDPVAPPSEPGNGRTNSLLVSNAYLIHSTETMAKVACLIGKSEDAKRFENAAVSLRSHFADEYITKSGHVLSDSQTAYALTILLSLFPSQSQEDYAASRLEEIIRSHSRFKIGTGFAGTPIISLALTKVGRSQLFYRMLMHRRNPSWLYPITMGATTTWERWDSMLPDGSINPGQMTSFNHYALGAVAQWMHAVMGGIAPIEPGWKKILVRPIPGGDVSWVRIGHLSPYGKIEASWEIVDKSTFTLNLVVPPNCSAEVVLPGRSNEAYITVGSGSHRFSCDFEAPEWPPLPKYPPFSQPMNDDEP